MEYLLLFLEGVITFVSPCLLPMLPIYISYFAGGRGKASAFRNSASFVLGFTLVFVMLGAFAGQAGVLLQKHSQTLNIVTGGIVAILGLNFLGVFNIPFLNMSRRMNADTADMGLLKSFTFGVVFSVSWTPCVSAFLGSALLLASRQGSVAKGVLMLLAYSAGLGIPFIASALLIDRLKNTFDFIKRHYRVINAISGGVLVVAGIFMMTGLFGYLLRFLTF